MKVIAHSCHRKVVGDGRSTRFQDDVWLGYIILDVGSRDFIIWIQSMRVLLPGAEHEH